MEKFDSFIRKHNPYSKVYEQMRNVENELAKENKSIPTIKLMFKKLNNCNNKRYVLPKEDEIAGVFVGDQGQPNFEIEFTVYRVQKKSKSFEFQTLNYRSPHVDPMTYPLLFIYGELGWSIKMNFEDFNQAKDESEISEEDVHERDLTELNHEDYSEDINI
jgi:hypothetical protein